MTKSEILLELLRSSIFDKSPIIPENEKIDWDALMNLASEQCLLVWVWDGINKLPKELRPSRVQAISWGLSAQEIIQDYDHKKQVLSQIINICSQNNIRVLLLKGIALSLLYPKPQYRASGDIDIFLLDNQYEKGNILLCKDEYSFGGKHSFFPFNGIMIENHMSIIDTYTRRQVKIEKFLETGLKDAVLTHDGYWVQAPFFHLMHLLVHTLSHIDYYSLYPLPIRNVLDFGMFLKEYSKVIDTNELEKTLKRFRLEKSFLLILNVAEKILDIRFLEYHFSEVSDQDVNKLENLIYSRDITPLPSQTGTHFSQMRERFKHYRRIHWLHKYLPYSYLEYVHSVVKREINFLFKRIVGISSDSSLREFINKKHHTFF